VSAAVNPGNGLRALGAAFALLAVALLAPAPAAATKVGLGASTDDPSECFEPQQARYASTHCQVFAGGSLAVFGVANRDDGGARLMPQPFTLLAGGPGRSPKPVVSFTYFDDNDADDEPTVTPRRDTDYVLRFDGNEELTPAESAPLVVFVGARVTIPTGNDRARSTRLSVPVRVTLPWRSLRGRLELRRCHRFKKTSAASCARRSSYTVVSSRRLGATSTVRFGLSAPPRSNRRYEVAFRPRAKGFTTTRQAFSVINGFDGTTSYRHWVRAAPFGNR
jgi:hypothetical protein